MKYLIDTNILLEVLLQQARAQEVKQLLLLTGTTLHLAPITFR